MPYLRYDMEERCLECSECGAQYIPEENGALDWAYCPSCGATFEWVDDPDAIEGREDDRIAAMRLAYFVGSGGRNIWGRA